MELLEGETLADRLRRAGPHDGGRGPAGGRQMADALAAAHAAGVVHRDFKSANVMLMPPASPGAAPRTVVTDFGLALRSQPRPRVDDSATTATTYMLGTPDYMAPEQVRGDAITPATDVYAFGIVLYEMVTGMRPFTADTAIETALRRLSDAPTSPTALVPGLPESWERAILACLSVDPAGRPAGARAVVGTLRGEPDGADDTRSATASDWKAYALAGASAIAVLGLMAYLYRPAAPPSTAAPAAVAAARVAEGPGGAATVARTPRRAVAVIGFRNLSGRADAAWLRTAFAEMLTTELAAGEALRTVNGDLVARTSADLNLDDADAFGRDTLAKLRGRLSSDLVVFGTYLAVGPTARENIRLDVRLQDAASGEVLTAFSETAAEAELPALVARAGARLRERLGASVADADTAAARAAMPSHPDAARLYAEGLARLREFDALAARDLLERAVGLQPEAPLLHAALADAWAALGYDERATRSAERARELSASLPRRQQLEVEATWRERRAEWPAAIAAGRALVERAPDDIEAVVRLAHVQTTSGDAKGALETLDAYRTITPRSDDPRLDLEEAAAAEILADFPRMQAAARRAADRGAAQGARLVVAGAGLLDGTAFYRMGKLDQAEARLQEARATYDAAGDRDGAARAMNSLAAVVTDRGDQRRGQTIYDDALKVARATGNQNLTARLLNNLAISYRRAGDLRRSLALNREALAIRREIGDRTNLAVSLNNIGNVLIDMGDLAGASSQYNRRAGIPRGIGDRRGLARALYNAGVALRLQWEAARSLAVNEEALEIPGAASTTRPASRRRSSASPRRRRCSATTPGPRASTTRRSPSTAA